MVLLLSGCAVAQYELGGGTCGRIALRREVAGMWSGMMWPIYHDLIWSIHIVLQCFIQCFTYDLHVGFVFVMWPFKLGALIASWFLDREPGFGIAWVWECINRFASGIHWDWWLRWGPRVWVLQRVLSSCCRCELLDDLFTIDTWGQNLTTKCFPQFHRFVHPDLLAAVTRSTGRMHFPWVLKTQTLSCAWRCWAKVTTRKCALVVGK
jgi:hypothetical protein